MDLLLKSDNQFLVKGLGDQQAHMRPNSWLMLNSVPSVKSLGPLTGGSHSSTCRLILGKATRDCRRGRAGVVSELSFAVIRTVYCTANLCLSQPGCLPTVSSSALGRAVLSLVCRRRRRRPTNERETGNETRVGWESDLKLSKEMLSSGLWFQAKTTAI